MASAISSHQLNYANILQILTKILNAGLDALMPMLLLLEHPVVGLILTLVLPILRTEAREEKKAKDSQTRHELKGTDELTDHASEQASDQNRARPPKWECHAYLRSKIDSGCSRMICGQR